MCHKIEKPGGDSYLNADNTLSSRRQPNPKRRTFQWEKKSWCWPAVAGGARRQRSRHLSQQTFLTYCRGAGRTPFPVPPDGGIFFLISREGTSLKGRRSLIGWILILFFRNLAQAGGVE